MKTDTSAEFGGMPLNLSAAETVERLRRYLSANYAPTVLNPYFERVLDQIRIAQKALAAYHAWATNAHPSEIVLDKANRLARRAIAELGGGR